MALEIWQIPMYDTPWSVDIPDSSLSGRAKPLTRIGDHVTTASPGPISYQIIVSHHAQEPKRRQHAGNVVEHLRGEFSALNRAE